MKPLSTAVSSSDLLFSETIKHGDTVYVSGQGPIDAELSEVVEGTVQDQMKYTLENVERILTAADTSRDEIVDPPVDIMIEIDVIAAVK